MWTNMGDLVKENKKSIASKENQKELEKVKVLLTMYYSDGLI